MFCEKCGAQLPDTASFCNKCGNTLRKNVNTVRTPVIKVPNIAIDQKKSFPAARKNDKESPKSLVRTLLLVVLIVIVAAIAIAAVKKKTSIYGTWTDANKTITFTFNKDGNLRISGANNILGADTFQFTEEKGVLHLQATGLAGIEFDLKYEIVDDALHISIGGRKLILYRMKSSDVKNSDAKSFYAKGSDSENSDVEDFNLEHAEEALKDWAEDALDVVQVYSLYGTWTDSSGAISFTFSKDGKLRVSGLEDTLSVDAFTFSEVDNDTLQLKAESDNPIVSAFGLNMDYEIEGDSMTVTIAGKELKLVKRK